jgi:hypothetical protein
LHDGEESATWPVSLAFLVNPMVASIRRRDGLATHIAGLVITVALCGACFSEETPPTGSVGTSDGETSTSDMTEGTGSVSSTTASSTSSSSASASTSATDVDDSDADTTTSGLQCPQCATGFCTADDTCAWGVFVTSETYEGDLGGLSGADAECNLLARNAGLVGTYMAWLSTHELSAVARIPGHTEPYVLVNGTLVADRFSVFTTHVPGDPDHVYLEHAIDRDENGDPPTRGTACPALPAGIPVWTSTLTDGSWNSYPTCDGWTSSGPSADDVLVGNARGADSFWTFWCAETDCSTTASLYCFQVSAP